MPKDRREHSWSYDRSRVSPFPCSSSSRSGKRPSASVIFSKSEEDTKEWEEAKCPVCMEHPHNAVLLLCSSHEKGCRPFMCDTSYRHSNCLDQFCKAFGTGKSSVSTSPMSIHSSGTSTEGSITNLGDQDSGQAQVEGNPLSSLAFVQCNSQVQEKLSCPLCRGQIKGWFVVEAARQFMNAKTRCCSSELCPFSGNYADLRKHARREHPLVRPSEVDEERQRDWRRLERQQDLGDVLSTLRSSFGEARAGFDDESHILEDGRGFLTVYFLVRIFRRSNTGPRGTSRRRMSLWGETLVDGESDPTREDDDVDVDDAEGTSGSWRQL